LLATQRDKAPRKTHHAPVIRADLDLLAEHPPDVQERLSAREARASQDNPSENVGTARPGAV
jgi:hypothetical protein